MCSCEHRRRERFVASEYHGRSQKAANLLLLREYSVPVGNTCKRRAGYEQEIRPSWRLAHKMLRLAVLRTIDAATWIGSGGF